MTRATLININNRTNINRRNIITSSKSCAVINLRDE